MGYSTNPDPGTKKDKHFKKSISIGIYYLFEMDPFGIKLGTVLSHQPFKKNNLAVVRKQIILNFRQGTGK